MATITRSDGIAATSRPLADSTWERRGAFGGIGFVVLAVIGSFLPGAAPAADASAPKIASYFKDHTGAIQAQIFITLIGVGLLLWWFGTLWRTMERAEGGRPRLAIVSAVSFSVGIALAMVSGVFTAAAATRADDLGAQTQLLYSLSLVAISAAGVALFVFLSAASMINHRARLLPVWTDYIGWIAAAAFLLSGFGVATDANAFNILGLVAFLAWCVWIVAVSVSMWRQPG